MSSVTSIDQLESIYGTAGETSIVKVTDRITADYRRIIEASPFLALATVGPEGLDCSPRGDQSHVVRVVDQKTIYLPDRRGNNRIDSLRNIVRDPRVALLFFLPGCGNTLRLNGKAHLTVDGEVLDSFSVEGKSPRCVVVIDVEEVYFQCARAIVRSELWNPEKYVDPESLPTAGQILSDLSGDRLGGEPYDQQWPERARNTLW